METLLSDLKEVESVEEAHDYYEMKLKELDYISKVNELSNGEYSDHANHVYRFDGGVYPKAVKKAIKTLAEWDRADKKAKWTFVINSFGGSVTDGLALFDDLVAYSKRGGGRHKITTVARGVASSMGSVLLQAGDVRVAGKYSSILIHEPSAVHVGSHGELTDQMALLTQMKNQMADIYCERSGMARHEFDVLWDRRDWWLTAEQSLANGFIDKIG